MRQRKKEAEGNKHNLNSFSTTVTYEIVCCLMYFILHYSFLQILGCTVTSASGLLIPGRLISRFFENIAVTFMISSTEVLYSTTVSLY